MLQAVEGIYRNGTIELLETPHNINESRVLITFLTPSELNPIEPQAPPSEKKKRNGFGILKGKLSISDDFDAPLEEFEEYL